jgi:hypothetical protein
VHPSKVRGKILDRLCDEKVFYVEKGNWISHRRGLQLGHGLKNGAPAGPTTMDLYSTTFNYRLRHRVFLEILRVPRNT